MSAQTGSESWTKLITLVGHYKDASDVIVKLFWDDATGDACLLVGSRFYADRSFELAVDKAYAAEINPGSKSF